MTEKTSLNLYGLETSHKKFYKKENQMEIGHRWDKKATNWEQHLELDGHHLNQDNAYNQFISISSNIAIQRFHKLENSKLLDIGCGTGLVAAALSIFFSVTTGIDISTNMLIQARSKHINNVEFYNKSLFEIKPEWNVFNMIVSRGILLSHYGLGYLKEILLLLHSCLKINGCVVFDFLNKNVTGKYEHLPKNKAYFSGSSIEKYALNIGFSNAIIVGNPTDRTLIAVLNK
jgi:predicted TPR repeat methyltransferase